MSGTKIDNFQDELGQTTVVGGVYFSNVLTFLDDPAGSGYIEPFLRIQLTGGNETDPPGEGAEAGFNYDHDPGSPDPANLQIRNDPWTNLLPISSLATVDGSVFGGGEGVLYVEFRLDINESNSGFGDQYLSLDALKIFVSNDATLHGYDPTDESWEGGSATKVYDLDAGEDRWIALNYDLRSGSGKGDLSVFLPWEWLKDYQYLYLYSQFGGQGDESGYRWSASGGFEEWAAVRGHSPQTFSISGQKFEDLNGASGGADADKALEGWKILLYLDDGDGIFDPDADFKAGETTTDAGGNYSFAGLIQGKTYWVTEGLQGGWYQVTDAGHPASWGPVTGAASHLDFFNTRYGEIVVCKYEDLNGDGCLSAGEKAAGTLGAGWTFFLDANGNGAWDAGEQKASTDETGCVTFTGIEIGRSYKVYELPGESPAASGGNGWYQTVGKDGIAVSVAQSGGTARADFGNTEYGKLVVTKYVDRNNDGDLNDKGEGNPYTGHGFTFRLKDLTTGQVVATITDGQDGALDGKVTFTGLIVGHKYKVIEVLGAGSPWFQTGSTNTCFKIDYSGECEQASFVNSRYEGLTPGYWKNHPDASKNPWPRRGLI